MEILWLGIGLLMLMEKKRSRDLGKGAAALTRTLLWEKNLSNQSRAVMKEVLGGSCIKGKLYKYSNWLLNKNWSLLYWAIIISKELETAKLNVWGLKGS